MRRLTRSPRKHRRSPRTPGDPHPRRGHVNAAHRVPGASTHRVLPRRSRPTIDAHATTVPVSSAPSKPAPRAASAARRNTVRCTAMVLAKVVVLAVVVSAAAAAEAHAEGAQVLAIAESVEAVLGNIRNWIMGVLAGIATVFLTIGGLRRVIGAGDPGEQEKAKECFKAAGIGYCLAALAPLVVTVLKGIVGA